MPTQMGAELLHDGAGHYNTNDLDVLGLWIAMIALNSLRV